MENVLGLPLLEQSYTIEKKLAQGGMGEVYLAKDNRLERHVAIKVLKVSNAESMSDFTEFVQRFHHEAKAIAKLSHPNIVTIHDFGEENSRYYMVMEYLSGKNLSDILKEANHSLPIAFVINIGIQICKALEYAHGQGVVHRDIKPDNIMFSKSGVIKLTDFGIAKHNEQENSNLTKAGQLLGSMVYSSPEQIQGSLEINHRTDLYSLGVTLYQLLVGTIPFTSSSMGDLIIEILTKTPNKPSYSLENIPKSLDDVIMKALAKSPNERFQSALEMEECLCSLELKLEKENILDLLNSKKIQPEADTLILKNDNHNKVFQNNLKNETFMKTIISHTSIIDKTKLDNTVSKTRTSLNKDILSKINPNIKNFLWISSLLENWNSEKFLDVDSKKIIKNVIKEGNFTGIIIFNRNSYVFTYNGYLIGAFSIDQKVAGNNIIKSIPDISSIVELKTPKYNSKFYPLLISNILTLSADNIFHSTNESSSELRDLISSLSKSEEKFTGFFVLTKESTQDKYYFATEDSKIIFSIHLEDSNVRIINNNIMELLNTINANMTLDIYKCRLTLLDYDIPDILSCIKAEVGYKNKTRSTLEFILDLNKNEEISQELTKSIKENLNIELNLFKKPRIDDYNVDFNLDDFVNTNVYLKFLNWMLNTYFYIIEASSNKEALGLIFNTIPKIKKVSFFKKYSEQINYLFPSIMEDENEKPLFLVTYGDCSKEAFEEFVTNVIEIKKIASSLQGAFYITTNAVPSDSEELFKKYTKAPAIKLFDKNAKYKALVRLVDKSCFQLNIIEYNSKILDFNSILPSLF
ncbi:MAG: serine/threonine-protein kinase [Cyanobacteriota bacterium]